jgi:hypothetical protein
MAIAFLPIDIDVRLPNEQVLLEYCNQYSITKDLAPEDEWSTSTWHIGPVMARMDSEEWYDYLRGKMGEEDLYKYHPEAQKSSSLEGGDSIFFLA